MALFHIDRDIDKQNDVDSLLSAYSAGSLQRRIPNFSEIAVTFWSVDSLPRTTRRHFLRSSLAAAAGVALAPSIFAESNEFPITLGAPAPQPIPLNYAGLSYEKVEMADPEFFSASDRNLVAIFRALSTQGVLRIGGNSSDYCWWKSHSDQAAPPPPRTAHSSANWMPHSYTAIAPKAVDNLAGFLDAAGWTVIYGLNLGTSTPEAAAEEAACVARTLGSRLAYFQIGNEPDYYGQSNNGLRPANWDFDSYFAQWLTFARAILKRVPNAQFGGPDAGSSVEWVIRFSEDAPQHLPGHIAACTSHYYAEGPPDDPRVTVARLLRPDPRVRRDMTRIMAAARAAHLPYRMTEGNSCYRGGKPGMSNAFCSALWAADYMLILAGYGCAGVNLHGGSTNAIRHSLGNHLPGLKVSPQAAAEAAQGSFYTPIAGSRQSGFTARPDFYGMKLATVLCGGHMRPVQLPVSGARATAYAAGFRDGHTRLVVINKDAQQPITLALRTRGHATRWNLDAASLTALTGVTLAGATLGEHPFHPKDVQHLAGSGGVLRVTLPPASAAAVFCNERPA